MKKIPTESIPAVITAKQAHVAWLEERCAECAQADDLTGATDINLEINSTNEEIEALKRDPFAFESPAVDQKQRGILGQANPTHYEWAIVPAAWAGVTPEQLYEAQELLVETDQVRALIVALRMAEFTVDELPILVEPDDIENGIEQMTLLHRARAMDSLPRMSAALEAYKMITPTSAVERTGDGLFGGGL